MKQKKLIAITGSGRISEVVANSLKQSGRYDVRIICSACSENAKAAFNLAGIEVMKINDWDLENLAEAFDGAYGVFGSTSDADYGAEEFRRGKIIIDAAKKTKVSHLVFETQPGYHAISNGVFRVPAFDVKALLEQYCKISGLAATYVQPAFYYENFIHDGLFRTNESRDLFFGFPQGLTPLAMASVADIGPLVQMIFRYPAHYLGRRVGIVGDYQSCTGYANILSEILKMNIAYRNIPNAEYVSMGGTVEEADMFDVQRLFIRNRQKDLIESYGLNPGMQPFRRWVKRNKAALIQVINSLGASAMS